MLFLLLDSTCADSLIWLIQFGWCNSYEKKNEKKIKWEGCVGMWKLSNPIQSIFDQNCFIPIECDYWTNMTRTVNIHTVITVQVCLVMKGWVNFQIVF